MSRPKVPTVSGQEPAGDPPFEAILARLGEIVGELEGGEIPLERALALFEEGVRLSRLGSGKLDDAEMRVEQLLKSGPDEKPRTRPLAGSDKDPR